MISDFEKHLVETGVVKSRNEAHQISYLIRGARSPEAAIKAVAVSRIVGKDQARHVVALSFQKQFDLWWDRRERHVDGTVTKFSPPSERSQRDAEADTEVKLDGVVQKMRHVQFQQEQLKQATLNIVCAAAAIEVGMVATGDDIPGAVALMRENGADL